MIALVVNNEEGTVSRTTATACFFAGAAILALGMRIPEVALPGAWLAFTLLVRGWRGMAPGGGLLLLGPILFAAEALGDRGTIPATGATYVTITGLNTALLLVPFVLDRAITRRGGAGWPSTLVFPMALVAQEFLRSRIPNGPASWGALGYTQYGVLPLMQLASVTGIWGLTFVIGWFASTASWAWARMFRWPAIRPLVFACGGTIGAVMLGGGLRLVFPPPSTVTIRAATVSFPGHLIAQRDMFRIADGRIPVDAAVSVTLERLHEWFFERTAREARAGAQLVAWPEMNFLVLASDEAAAIDRARRLAAAEHIYLAMAIGTMQPGATPPFRNTTVLVEPSGRIAYSYAKTHPVMGWEASVIRAGAGRLPVVATDVGRLSTAICFDADHPDLVRQVGLGRADLWILPANDWAAIARTHFAMAVFRAIETGTPLLRAASFGISGGIDALGRVHGATDHLSGPSSLVVELPVGGVATAYAVVGDLFAWLCVAGTLLVSLSALALALPRRAWASSRRDPEPSTP